MKNSPIETFKHGIAKPVLPAVLKLTIKKEWFDLIKSGEKTEEYREVKSYWESRLQLYRGEKISASEWGRFYEEWYSLELVNRISFQNYEYIEFKNGYSKDAPTIITECKGISVGKPTQNGKHLFDNDVFIISIGDIVWSNCG